MGENNHRLMVVDDDQMNLDMLARRLERHGYTVVRATGGMQALEYLKAGNVELILLDHQMPDMTGLEFLRRVRLSNSSTALPIIMVTAASDTNTVMAAVSLGANDFITKPVDMSRVLARIRSHLGQVTAQPRP
jgi:DNA-binding response OmpR family regulator